MKKAFISLTFILSLLVSCASIDRTYSFSSVDGMKVFLRPVTLKGVVDVMVDMTFSLDKSRISGDSVVNYSIFIENGALKDKDSVYLLFSNEDGSFKTENNELMYQEGNGTNKRELRYSSTLSASSTLSLLSKREIDVSLSFDGRLVSLEPSSLSTSLESVMEYVI